MNPGRNVEIALAVSQGKKRDDVAQDPEEVAYWDSIVKSNDVIRETGGVIDVQWDDVGTPDDFMADLYSGNPSASV